MSVAATGAMPKPNQACPLCGAPPYVEHLPTCKWHPYFLYRGRSL